MENFQPHPPKKILFDVQDEEKGAPILGPWGTNKAQGFGTIPNPETQLGANISSAP